MDEKSHKEKPPIFSWNPLAKIKDGFQLISTRTKTALMWAGSRGISFSWHTKKMREKWRRLVKFSFSSARCGIKMNQKWKGEKRESRKEKSQFKGSFSDKFFSYPKRSVRLFSDIRRIFLIPPSTAALCVHLRFNSLSGRRWDPFDLWQLNEWVSRQTEKRVSEWNPFEKWIRWRQRNGESERSNRQTTKKRWLQLNSWHITCHNKFISYCQLRLFFMICTTRSERKAAFRPYVACAHAWTWNLCSSRVETTMTTTHSLKKYELWVWW